MNVGKVNPTHIILISNVTDMERFNANYKILFHITGILNTFWQIHCAYKYLFTVDMHTFVCTIEFIVRFALRLFYFLALQVSIAILCFNSILNLIVRGDAHKINEQSQ